MTRPLANIERRLAEAEARQGKVEIQSGGSTAPDFTDANFPAQLALLLDVAALLVVLCTRRASKSFSAAKRLLRAMYEHPGCSVLFIALTDDSAMNIIWKDVLKVIDRRWKLGAKFSETKQTMTLPNGSVLYVLGMDRDEEERNKLLGGKYAEVAIDESASFTTDLHELVFGVLKPAVADYRGTIGLYGTPGNVKAGLFFELTKGEDPSIPHQFKRAGFSGHCWNTFANPYMADKWRAEITDLKAANPLIEDTPTFKQNYLGQWVIDDSKLVYKFLVGRNQFDGELPKFRQGRWHYVLGIDTGWKASAFSLVTYHDHSTELHVLESWKRRGMIISAISDVVRDYERRFDIERTVVDGANKQAVEEINQRHRVTLQPLEAAQKRDKFQFIDLMNDDFIQKRIKVSTERWGADRVDEFTDIGRCGTEDYASPFRCGNLVAEYATLVVDERLLAKSGKRDEHPNCENHCADATLYPWRYAYPYMARALKTLPAAVGTAAWHEEEAKRQQQREDEELNEAIRQAREERRAEMDVANLM